MAVDHFSDPYRRVRYPDGDWEELNRQGIKPGKELAAASVRTGCARRIYWGAGWNLERSESPAAGTGKRVGDLTLNCLFKRRV